MFIFQIRAKILINEKLEVAHLFDVWLCCKVQFFGGKAQRLAWVLVPALNSCTALRKLLNLSEPQSPLEKVALKYLLYSIFRRINEFKSV